MTTVVEGLALAIQSLPKSDKTKFVALLLGDPDIRESMAEHLFGKPVEPVEKREDGYRSRPENSLETGVTSKERGKRLRETYVSDLRKKGVHIDQVESVWGRTVAGSWVAMPTANMEWRPSRWFLGLPEDKIRERIGKEGVVVVLLCQSASGLRLDFVISSHQLEMIMPKLSRSAGQVKFNLKKVGNSYQLVIPHSGPVDISDNIGNLSVLQS